MALTIVLQNVAFANAAEINTQEAVKKQYLVSTDQICKIKETIGKETLDEFEFLNTRTEFNNSKIAVANLTSSDIAKLKRVGIVPDKNTTFTALTGGKEQAKIKLKMNARKDWNIDAINARKYLRQKTESGNKVKVAVLDTGINYRSDLPVDGRVTKIDGITEINPIFEDVSGHGTAVASLIASQMNEDGIQGINSNVSLYSVQVLDSNNKGKLSEVIQGIYWCIEKDMDIINMSFGTPENSSVLHQAIKDAYDSGILIVAASGNSGNETSFPAAYQEVISVGSTDMSGEISESSARGEAVDIYAPGECILVNDSMFGMTEAGGSSLAAAAVTGAASLLLEENPDLSNSFLKELLVGTANRNIEANQREGLLDVSNAMEHLADFSESHNSKIPFEKSESSIAIFDDAEVRALWTQDDHYKTITDGISGKRLIAAAAKCPDDATLPGYNYNQLNLNRRFHGSKNYVTTLKFLVDLANAYYNMDSAKVNDLYNNPRENLGIIEDPAFKYSVIEATRRFAQHDYYLAGAGNSDRGNGSDLQINHNKAYKIIGLAVHLAGDIYAHRVVVSTDMINAGAFNSGDFKNMSTFKNAVSNGDVDFRNISEYTTTPNSMLYEDNTNCIRNRYKYSEQAVQNILSNFRTRKFDITWLTFGVPDSSNKVRGEFQLRSLNTCYNVCNSYSW